MYDFSIEAHGGGVNNPDNTAALILAMAANNGAVEFGPGTYCFAGSPVVAAPSNKSILIQGYGADVTNFQFAPGHGLTTTITGNASGVHIRDFTMATTGQGSAAGLTIQQTTPVVNPAVTAFSDVTNITFRGADGYVQNDYWNACIDLENASNVDLIGCTFNGSLPGANGMSNNGNGVILQGNADGSVQFNVTDCMFNSMSGGIIYGTNVQGLTVSQTNFTGVSIGITSAPGEVNLDQLSVSQCQFNCGITALNLMTVVPSLSLSDNLVILGKNALGFQIFESMLYSIVGNSFNVAGTPKIGQNGIIINNTMGTGGIITANTFASLVTAIWLQSGSKGANVQANAYWDCLNTVVNDGTGNTVGIATQ